MVPTLLREALGHPVPDHTEALVTPPEPTAPGTGERLPHVVVSPRDGGRDVPAVVVGPQVDHEAANRLRWAEHVAATQSKWGCPVVPPML
ncbi:hypothetical protein PWG71_27380 [Nocardiopsis sp. N85]|uniref:hypothetical protein n=1 Tax=Nocardiopsis sp. N85 TaxID=3029400 RepID=UPI00237F1C87|nr:hypothetical protein [Nocardiopsis sp. N85]MDE3725120.1 hypothetical protein [Nocardiopsis sp. N85]